MESDYSVGYLTPMTPEKRVQHKKVANLQDHVFKFHFYAHIALNVISVG
jgi:hypothetical protein